MIVVYSTFPNVKEARRISKTLVERKLVACANILNGHESFYWWEGKVEQAQEVAVIYKTKPELFQSVQDLIVKEHSYDVPCVVSWNIEQGFPEFLQWIESFAV